MFSEIQTVKKKKIKNSLIHQNSFTFKSKIGLIDSILNVT
jgi:hypothetical protein